MDFSERATPAPEDRVPRSESQRGSVTNLTRESPDGPADVSQSTLSDPEDYFATPAVGKSKKDRVSAWRFSKVAQGRAGFKMSDLGGFKGSITRALKEVAQKYDNINLLIKNVREDKAIDIDAPEIEQLQNELEDLLALDATVNRTVLKGNERCGEIEDGSPIKIRWESYLADHDQQFADITKMTALIRSTIKRAEERAKRKMATQDPNSVQTPQMSGSAQYGSSGNEQSQIPRGDGQQTPQNASSPRINLETPQRPHQLQFDSHESRVNANENVGLSQRLNREMYDQYAVEPELPRHFFKMELPVFEGHHYQWSYFWSMFDQYVHSKPYEDVIKLNILIKHCRGKALKYVESAIYGGNRYQGAIDSLRRQFDNAYHKKSALLKSIEILPPAEDNSDSLDETLTTLKKYIGGLAGYEHTNTTYFRREIKCKFPIEVIMRLERNERRIMREWSTDELLEELEHEVAMKRAEEEQLANRREVEFLSNNMRSSLQISRGQQSSAPRSHTCIFCSRGHPSMQCRSMPVPRLADRIVRNAKLCTICLSAEHEARTCSRDRCGKCGGAHWNKLCFKNGNSGNDRPSHPYQQGQSSQQNAESVNYRNPVSTQNASRPRGEFQNRGAQQNAPRNFQNNPRQNGNWQNNRNSGNENAFRQQNSRGNQNQQPRDCGPTPFRGARNQQ